MAMRHFRGPGWLAVALVAVLVSGCDDVVSATSAGGGGAPTGGAGTATAGTTAGGNCGRSGSRVGHWLPVLDDADPRQANITTHENPCLPLSGLIGLVDAVIPSQVPDLAGRRVEYFRTEVRRTASRFVAAHDGIECGYQTDGLAVVTYQHVEHPWSVGLVVVVRLGFDAIIDAGFCYLGKQLGVDGPHDSTRSDGNQPQPTFCGLAAQPRSADGERYAVVALGTSTWMCAALEASPAGLVQVS